MRAASFLGGPYGILSVTTLGVWGLSTSGQMGKAVIFLLIVTASICYALLVKLLTARRRPSHGLERQRTYAFPSAHSLASSVVLLSLGFEIAGWLGWPAGPVFLSCLGLLVLMIGLSRVYLGVHYPSDVLAGFIAGGTWVWIYLFLTSGT
jgi:membrane-associated phospholipid phosphatase